MKTNQTIIAMSGSTTAAAFIIGWSPAPTWTGILILAIAILPILAFFGIATGWKPWFKIGIEQDFPEPSSTPIAILAAMFDLGAAGLAWANPIMAVALRGIGLLVQWTLIGKYSRETFPRPADHDHKEQNQTIPR